MRRYLRPVLALPLLLALLLMLNACNGTTTTPTPEATPEPETLLRTAVEIVQAAETFRMDILQTGAPFSFSIPLPAIGSVGAVLESARAQYVAPDTMQASARIVVGSLPYELLLFSRGDNQWLSLDQTTWVNLIFAQGFNPALLTQDGGGFESALAHVSEIVYEGQTTYEIGNVPVHHISGRARGEAVSALLVNLLQLPEVLIDVYIETATGRPLRIVLTLPEGAEAQETAPTTWRIDIYDYNAPAELDDPEA